MNQTELPLLNNRTPQRKSDRPIHIDLFAGAGGLSQGLCQAGFDCLYANEIRASYAQTYAFNHTHTIVDNRDIRIVDARRIREFLGLKKGQLDLLAGGPPCQGFSINAPVRSEKDERNHLFKEFLRFVEEFLPKSVLIENVPGLVSFQNGMTLQAILDALQEYGYCLDVRILFAPHYGVPQSRWRTVIIGKISGDTVCDAFPLPEFSAPVRVNFTSKFKGKNIVPFAGNTNLPKFISVRDALSDLPPLKNGEEGDIVKKYHSEPNNYFQENIRIGSCGVYNHQAAKLSRINEIRISHIPPGGNWTNIPENLLPAGMTKARRSDHTKRYGRINPEGLASTILTKCDPHWGAYIHYDQDRAFTVREAARIQTFPDKFKFTGSRVEQYEQVGNAVPPLLACAIGKSIINSLGFNFNNLKKAI